MSQAVQVKSLHVYPIKSVGGIDLSEVSIGSRGFEYESKKISKKIRTGKKLSTPLKLRPPALVLQ